MLNNNKENQEFINGETKNSNTIHKESNDNNPLDSYLLEKTVVVKVGGSTLGFDDTTLSDIVKLKSQGYFPIVVHGGGSDISEWMQKIFTRNTLYFIGS